MPALPTYQYRKFGPTASVILLSKFAGAVLGGVWISSKGSAGSVAVYDNSASLTTGIAIAATSVGVVGKFLDGSAIEFGKGLAVKVASCSGTIFWRPGQAGGA